MPDQQGVTGGGAAGEVRQARAVTDAAGGWPVTKSSVLAAGSVAAMRRDMVKMPDGAVVARDVIEHPGAVAIVAMDELGRVLMIRQYRHPARATFWELPAGLRDVAGEPLLATAQRELVEETGYQAADWRVLADFFPSPGITNERLRVFLAKNVTLVPADQREYVRQHEEAYLTVAWVPLADAVRGVLAGDLHNGVAIVGILSAQAAQKDGFEALRTASDPENI